MEIVQTVTLTNEEMLAICKTLSICDELSELAHTDMVTVFRYLCDEAEIVDEYKYNIRSLLQIAEIG